MFFSTSRIDSLDQLETAIKFFDSNLKILQFSEKSSKKGDHGNHANPLQWKENKGKDGKSKGKDKDEKGKGKDKDKHHKGRQEQRKGRKREIRQGWQGQQREGRSSKGQREGLSKDNKDKKKEERLKNIKCYNCDQYGHYSNKCPKPKREKASAGLLEPQVAAASLEPQLFAVALELECPVVALDAEDSGSDLSGDDWEESGSVYDLPWEGEGRVALDGGFPGVVLEGFPEVPVELAESFEIPNRIPVELAESLEIPNRIPVELAEIPEIPFDFAVGSRLSLKSRRFCASFQNGVELGCCRETACEHEHVMVARGTEASSTQQHARSSKISATGSAPGRSMPPWSPAAMAAVSPWLCTRPSLAFRAPLSTR